MIDIDATIVLPSIERFDHTPFQDEFRILCLPIAQEDHYFPTVSFGNSLEDIFAQEKPDLIVHDCNPVRWLSTTQFPECPRVNITNVFLTGIAKAWTVQKLSFAWFGNAINKERKRKGMRAIRKAHDIYDADEVLLADPECVIEAIGKLPEHFKACGACWWEADGKVPNEIKGLNNFLLCSMGSTGTIVNDEFCRMAAEKFDCQDIVRVHAQGKEGNLRHLGQHRLFEYRSLPLGKIVGQAGAVITQGGTGSTYQALGAGKPVIIVPTHSNHALLGKILAKFDLARVVRNKFSLALMSNLHVGKLKTAANGLNESSVANDGPKNIAKRIVQIVEG